MQIKHHFELLRFPLASLVHFLDGIRGISVAFSKKRVVIDESFETHILAGPCEVHERSQNLTNKACSKFKWDAVDLIKNPVAHLHLIGIHSFALLGPARHGDTVHDHDLLSDILILLTDIPHWLQKPQPLLNS